ncbi:MAG: nucleotidyltransferase family protein [Vicinamibacterales bacterium]
MKAFLLAGGRGERLRPLTLSLPKCLVPVGGRPLLAIWLDLCRRHGIREVLLNVSQHADLVRAFLASAPREPAVRLVVEDEPIGSGGTLRANRDFVAGADDFWILYADTLTTADLGAMADAHRRHDGIATLGLFHAPDPTAAGIVEIAADGRVVGFEEKPARPRGDLANAGIAIARPALFDHIPRRPGVVDLGHDVWPRLAGRAHGYVITDLLLDVGTPAALERAGTAWRAANPGGTSA